MGVDLCGGQAAVAQEFLYRIQIGPIVHQVCRKGMTEHMGAFLVQGTGLAQHLVYQQVGILGVEFFPLFRYQQGVA